TGSSSLEEMIANTERGLLVTSFHYSNAVDPMALSITGMTRGGTWLIENGKAQHPVTNMRFTQSLISALSNIKAISKDASFRAGGLFGGGMVLPAMAIGGFNFSSETGF
ncbi:MAG: TldD/PmbA family protein, partial [Planctomycetes bacterium]|nr:TldD/PmbA family protein [Planctomycetota bacterium]